jgi:hypothetical protein
VTLGCPNPTKDIIICASITDNHPTHYHIPLKSTIPPWVITCKEKSLSILENNFWEWKEQGNQKEKKKRIFTC